MKYFNKIFKQIVLENQFYPDNMQNNKFPQAFSFPDYGLEFIFDIMPTFGTQYQWHTVEDLKNIPELVSTLENTDEKILQEIADGFQDAGTAEQEQYPDEQFQQPQNLREIANWIRTIKNNTDEVLMQTEDLNIHDAQCFNTVPNVVKQVKPRPYRRGLKALSIPNRRKFNKSKMSMSTEFEEPKTQTDILNKVKDPKIVQQPVSKSTIIPAPGVNRPVGLDRSQKKIKRTFTNMVYNPSITQLAKQTAKKRCLEQRRVNKLYSEDTNDLEFSTNYSQPVKPHIKPDPLDPADDLIKKELCIVCKEYVEPHETTLPNGKTVYECPKCGLRITKNNYK